MPPLTPTSPHQTISSAAPIMPIQPSTPADHSARPSAQTSLPSPPATITSAPSPTPTTITANPTNPTTPSPIPVTPLSASCRYLLLLQAPPGPKDNPSPSAGLQVLISPATCKFNPIKAPLTSPTLLLLRFPMAPIPLQSPLLGPLDQTIPSPSALLAEMSGVSAALSLLLKPLCPT